MAIDSQVIYEGKVAQFGMGSGTTRFTNDFVRALNCVATELANDINTAFVAVTKVGESLAYPNYCQAALETGLDYWLIRFGNKTGQLDIGVALQTYNDARSELRLHIDLATQRSLSTYNGAGQIGLTA